MFNHRYLFNISNTIRGLGNDALKIVESAVDQFYSLECPAALAGLLVLLVSYHEDAEDLL